jgi:hypothetical protein
MSVKHSMVMSLLLLATARSAHAQDVKRECVDASTLGQTQRNAGQLLEARAQFLACAREACPEVVRNSCNRWLAEVEELTPSVVIRAADLADSDITDGAASIDGVSYPLDGKTISLNPGKHLVVVETHDGARAEKKVLLASGEKSRLIELRLQIGKPPETGEAAATAAQPEVVAPAHRADKKSGIPTGSWVLGGVSLVAFGSFTFFAVSANSEYSKLKDACAPSCSNDQMQTGRTNALLADISLGVGVAALAGGITWAVLAPRNSERPVSAARLSIAPTPLGGYAAFSAAF